MKHVDLVVTCDTSIERLGSALGVPVWVALPYVADWRWMLEREDSPWYPAMRLFRQDQPGNWNGGGSADRPGAGGTDVWEAAVDPILIEISPGELIDRITILQIKVEKQVDRNKRMGLQEELAALMQRRDRLPGSPKLDALAKELAAVNRTLWQVEDELRLCERRGEFGPRFIELARSVYRENDRRSVLRCRIDQLLGANRGDEKIYSTAS